MAEMTDLNHVVEIPEDGEHQKQIMSAIQDHPLMEISESPGHLLLLKLLQREEDLSGRRISVNETRLDTLRREIFLLCIFFFVFHGLFLTIVFTSSNNDVGVLGVCQKWWIPMITSLSFCTAMVFLVQMKLYRYWKVYGRIQQEKTNSRGLTRYIQELRMKGASFDLSKETGLNGKMTKKSSSVEIKWKPITWCSKYFVTIGLVSASSLALPLYKFMICA